ncbi:MAG: hypothetical protein GXO87_07935 [Chlorobi bacterium]|nr:hypothetical protein [Chlorobiota bacterium]
MALNNNQKNFILKNRKKISPKKIAAKLNLPVDEINKFLEENPLPKTPKIFYLFLILIPILFFVLLEIGLRVADYGYDTTTWVTIRNDYLGLNPDVARRYFYNIASVPESIQDVFHKNKPKNSFRVFVLGGSSAAGYPYMPFGSFSRYLRKRLEIAYPDKQIEVVNLSLTAVNSYTIRDLIPDALEQKPDLILIYAGHNEYYGALGVGSLESLGRSRTLVNFLLDLNQFKTIQLLRNVIQSGMKLFQSDENANKGTLMARMAQKKSIPFDSDIFNDGLDQFEGNMRDVIEMIKEKNVPVILSTLSSNLKGLAPFVSKSSGKFPPAKEVFTEAQKAYSAADYEKADSLYRFAKDLDMLRFRAPEKMNNIIRNLSKEYNAPLINVDSLFASVSGGGIPGNNLFVDHLHPTLRGYKLIGKLFYDGMLRNSFLPKETPAIPFERQDSLTLAGFVYSSLDSTIANFKIRLLKNDWPFVTPAQKKPTSLIIQPKNFIDSLAFEFVTGKEQWEKAHRRLAARYLRERNYKEFIKIIELLIYQYPTIPDYYNMISNELLKLGKYDEVYDFLKRRYKVNPDYFSTKWIGAIELSREHIKPAIKYLEESLKFKQNDPQVLYNLSGAYANNGEYKKALNAIESCLTLKPNYKGGKQLRNDLRRILKIK